MLEAICWWAFLIMLSVVALVTASNILAGN